MQKQNFQLAYVQSFQLTTPLRSSDWSGIVTLFLKDDLKRKLTLDVTERSFATSKRYGWFQFLDGVFYDISNPDQIEFSDLSAFRVGYLVLRLTEKKEISFLSLQTKHKQLTLEGKESELLLELFSALRTARLDFLVSSGVDRPTEFLSKKHWSAPALLQGMEVFDLSAFARGYAHYSLLPGTANQLKARAEDLNLLPYLRELANQVGLSAASLLDLPKEDLLGYFGLSGKNYPAKQKQPTLVRDTLKRATRYALLQALLLANPEMYTYALALPQQACYQILSASSNAARTYYASYEKVIQPEAQNEDYLYAQKTTPEDLFPVVDEIEIFLRIPSSLLVAESSKAIKETTYWFELNKAGQLQSNLVLNNEQKAKVIAYLPKASLSRKDIGRLLEMVEFRPEKT